MRRPVLLVVAAALVWVPVACGDDGGNGEGAQGQVESTPRPPARFEGLAAIFDPVVEPYGLRITRGSLVDRAIYEESPTGNHLALYVEPDGEYSTADYVDGITELTNLLTPYIFERFTEIDSYDICQEPLPGVDDREVPPPVSQVLITRDEAGEIDFPVDLATLRELYEDDRIELLHVNRTIERTSAWKDAAPEAS